MKTPTALKTNQKNSKTSPTPKDLMQIGVIGLGTMGRNFLLNIADHGFGGAGYDKSTQAVKTTQELAEDRRLYATADLKAFVQALERPRAIVVLVPAPVVDHVLTDVIPLLSAGDIIVDGGNSNFVETEWRERTLAAQGIHFVGMGISGGEEGARHGPSMMPGGFEDAYERWQPILEAASAHVNGDPCVAYLGPRGAGHYVKMVHNG
ncbi:MAG: NAD(P)-binding domain-containing protein, partial [Caldilineaceae bacterium]|nr:NAD(P)-binding domain-containing protein [Caldilineaceae bacterium]